MSKLIYGIGFYEEGKYAKRLGGKDTKEYTLWKSMLERCYSAKCQMRYPISTNCLTGFIILVKVEAY